VKYRGGKPRGFTVLTARSNTGRAVAGEFNSPRPSRDGSAGIYTRTLNVREGRRLHPARQLPSHHAESAGFERGRIPPQLPTVASDWGLQSTSQLYWSLRWHGY